MLQSVRPTAKANCECPSLLPLTWPPALNRARLCGSSCAAASSSGDAKMAAHVLDLRGSSRRLMHP
eukprot:9389219-Pyramimonas_sp.AAC.1